MNKKILFFLVIIVSLLRIDSFLVSAEEKNYTVKFLVDVNQVLETGQWSGFVFKGKSVEIEKIRKGHVPGYSNGQWWAVLKRKFYTGSHDKLIPNDILAPVTTRNGYLLTVENTEALERLGLDLPAIPDTAVRYTYISSDDSCEQEGFNIRDSAGKAVDCIKFSQDFFVLRTKRDKFSPEKYGSRIWAQVYSIKGEAWLALTTTTGRSCAIKTKER